MVSVLFWRKLVTSDGALPITSGEMLEPSKAAWSAPRIATRTTKKRQWVIVVSDSLLRGTEAPICWPDALSREVCCLLGGSYRGCHQETTKPCTVNWLLSAAVVSCVHQWYSQEQSEEYQEGLWSSSEGLRNTGSFFINPPSQREGPWKGQWNLANQQMVTGLVPQPGVWLLRLWE